VSVFRISPGSVRVFCGYRRPDVAVQEFRSEIGRTFMPGTPYLLGPLGLRAYAAAVLDEDEHDTPHETAIIAYPSRDAYRSIREDTLPGRLYTQTHAGVFDQGVGPDGARRSRADWAEPLGDDGGDAASGTWYLLGGSSDLQEGSLSVHVGVPLAPEESAERFTRAVRQGLPELRARVRDAGFTEAFISVRDGFYLVWLHAANEARVDPLDGWIGAVSRRITSMQCRPVLAPDEPPTVAITHPVAVNFIFPRMPRGAPA
jgi:hypothetical protein